MLTMHMIRVMDKMWLADDLDLKMVTFACVPTGDKQGIMEMVRSLIFIPLNSCSK